MGPRKDFRERRDRKKKVTSWCKRCLNKNAKRYRKPHPKKACQNCGKARKLKSNRLCRSCNLDKGLRECRICLELLPAEFSFYPTMATCKKCLRKKRDEAG